MALVGKNGAKVLMRAVKAKLFSGAIFKKVNCYFV